MFERLKKWIAPLLAGLAAILFILFRQKQDQLTQAKTELNTQKLTNELNGLKEESTHANQQASQDAGDYDNLKHSNAELLNKLGIPARPDARRDTQND